MDKTLFIKFKTTGKIHPFPILSKEKFEIGDRVVVEIEQGVEIGTVIEVKKKKSEVEIKGKVRKLTEKDQKKIIELKPQSEEIKQFCQEKISELGLSMKLIDAEISLDEKKITFYFMSEERVDFRELLSLLIARYHKNIRLQQLGPRDVARILGGFGCCGRPCCCKAFLENINSIKVNLAKEQSLRGVGSSKITGLCGKLMCCLNFEAKDYKEVRKKLPEVGKKIKTEKGMGKVIAQNIISSSVIVKLEDGSKIEQKIE